VTAEDYEIFVAELCGLPPGPDRDYCMKRVIARLLALHEKYGGTPAPGLREFARQIGVDA
jgi:hypothetical protein